MRRQSGGRNFKFQLHRADSRLTRCQLASTEGWNTVRTAKLARIPRGLLLLSNQAWPSQGYRDIPGGSAMVTTATNLDSGMMQYDSQDGTPIDAYLSQPSGSGRYPGVIVTMEGMGLEDHMKDLCRRFAEQGYMAITPDLYTREGRPAPDNSRSPRGMRLVVLEPLPTD